MKNSKNRWWDWTGVVCFFAGMLTAAYRLSDTKWTDDLNLVITLTFIGVILGLVLGISRLKPWAATLVGLGYTLVVIPWQLVHIVPEGTPALERFITLVTRFTLSFNQFLRDEPLTDPVLFLFNMALLFWLVTVVGGYLLTRYGRPWLSMIIAGAAIIIFDIYHPAVGKGGVAMAVYLIFAMLLVTRMHFLHRKREWEGDDIAVDNETGGSWSRGAIITALVLVVLAWNVNTVVKAVSPDSPTRHGVITAWNDIRMRFENAVKPLRGTTVVSREYYGDQFGLGTGSQLSDIEVFTVTPSISKRIGVPYYWRIRSYDTYRNGEWINTIKNSVPLKENNAVVSHENYSSRINISFTFYPARNLSMLYAPSAPLLVSRPVTLQYDKNQNGLVDITAVEVDPLQRAGDSYKVISMIAVPTVSQLKAAGTNYPVWVKDKYLQLPDNFPNTIAELAKSITNGLETPYEKAEAITNWLRTHLAYNAVLPPIPPGVDSIEWVLFDLKQAFCNYYSTAEILMLRSLGIPARWVVGYAQGQYDADTRSYVVSQKDSHAWPEVFFPGYGWIEFEPTASQSEISRPSGTAGGSTNPGQSNPGASAQMDEGNRGDSNSVQNAENTHTGASAGLTTEANKVITRDLIIAGFLLFIAAGVVIAVQIGRRNPEKALPVVISRSLRKRGVKLPVWLDDWAVFIRLSPIERSFLQVNWMLRFLGDPAPAGATPAEQSTQLADNLPEGIDSIRSLLDEYQKDVYSPYPGDADTAEIAARSLWILARRARINRFTDWITGSSRRDLEKGPRQLT